MGGIRQCGVPTHLRSLGARERWDRSYCTCSLGWMKETFEAVMGRPVDVTLVESVKRGGQRCQFMIQL